MSGSYEIFFNNDRATVTDFFFLFMVGHGEKEGKNIRHAWASADVI